MYDEETTLLDKILLIARRIVVILFIIFLIWIIFNKFILNKDKTENSIVDSTDINETILENNSEWLDIKDLWKNYSINENWEILYKKDVVKFANSNTFQVIDQKGRQSFSGMVNNSENLLFIFADSATRRWLMKNIDGIIRNKKGLSNDLLESSKNGMYKIQDNYDVLSQFDWGDRYDMTNKQRAKFAIMFLYLKIAKWMANNQATMEAALLELKDFIENFDKRDLKKELHQADLVDIKWDIARDDHCIYVDGELYACILDWVFE